MNPPPTVADDSHDRAGELLEEVRVRKDSPTGLIALQKLLQRHQQHDAVRPDSETAADDRDQFHELLAWIHSQRHLYSRQELSRQRSADETLDWQLGIITAQLQEVVADYHYDFLAEERPVIRDYIAAIPTAAQPLFTLALIAKDVELRTRRAEIISFDDYRADFSELEAEIREIIGGSEPDVPVLYGDRYRLRRELRNDLAGNAYEADDRRFRRAVIVRFLEFVDHEEFEQFYKECWIAAKFSNPHVIPIYDQGLAQGSGFVVHELLTGETLLELVQRKRVSLQQAVRWCLNIADMLAAAHEHDQPLYRDLRPQQFLITPNGNIKLLNSRLGVFPLCRWSSAEDVPVGLASPLPEDCQRRTPADFVDFCWSSPEQLAGDMSPSSQVFQLGALLYFVLTGQPPFPPATTARAAMELRHKTPPAAQLFRPELPTDLADFCERSLAFKPDDRPGSIRLWREELLKFTDLTSSKSTDFSDSTNSPTSARVRPTMTVPDRYVVDKLLGQGGWAEVWRARDTSLRRDVALKLLRFNFEEQHKRFVREARMSASLKHPLIVGIYDHGTFDGQAYIAYELIHGSTLTEHVAQQGLPEPTVAAEWCRDIARAIQFAHSHEKQVVHRDLTPNNVMLTAEKRIKVLDFGLAIYLNPGSVGEISVTHYGVTRFRGTYRWTSPEQLDGIASPLSDVHGIGSILYFLLTGDCPFGGSDFGEAVERRQKPPAPVQTDHRRIPTKLEEICLRALQPVPQFRHSSAAQLADDLDEFLQTNGKATEKPSLFARFRRLLFKKSS